jgi:uncharacterized protein (DUF983 family)
MGAMSFSSPPPPSSSSPPSGGRPRAGAFIRRALRLRCPECGRRPIFVRARDVRSVDDWFRPLDGCPECGYAYEREEGYFLLATWAVNYGVVAGGGLVVGLILQEFTGLSTGAILLVLAGVMPFASLAFTRHAKALFLAMDHYFDPHVVGRRRRRS